MELIALRKYVDDNGGPKKAAEALNLGGMRVTDVTLCAWIKRGQVPAHRAPLLETCSGIDRRQLRPLDWMDYWPELKPVRVFKGYPGRRKKTLAPDAPAVEIETSG